MDRLGFIHERLDIKILILYILRRLPKPVRFEALSDLVMVDDGFDYFDYVQCLAELVETGNVEQSGNSYKITPTGEKNSVTVESSIPYSVRLKADKNAKPLIEKMKRDSLIGTSHEVLKNGGCNVSMSLSDGLGEIISLSILASDENQAIEIEKHFRRNAENIYHEIIKLLTAEG